MITEEYGFVYLWYDRKHKRYYVGCHWGREDDGYVCSSTNMKHAFKRRPVDFKRRIVEKIYTSKTDLLEAEYRWLSMIKPEELRTRYYNLHNHHFGHWTADKSKSGTIGEKIRTKLKTYYEENEAYWQGKTHSEESKEKMRHAKLGHKQSPEQIQKRIANTHRDYSDPIFLAKMSSASKNRSQEHRRRLSENMKRQHKEGLRIGAGMTGRKHSEESKEKMRQAKLGTRKTEHIIEIPVV